MNDELKQLKALKKPKGMLCKDGRSDEQKKNPPKSLGYIDNDLTIAYLAGAKDYKDKLAEAVELLKQVDYEEGHGIDCHIPHSTWQKRKEQFLERNK